MPNLDEFESVFRAAAKSQFEYHPVRIDRVLVLTDRTDDQAQAFFQSIQRFLQVLGDDVRWELSSVGALGDVEKLLEHIEASSPDLVCAHRNLSGTAGSYPYSLGSYIDVVTQAIPTPVLLLPDPEPDGSLPTDCKSTKRVMALTNDLTGEHALPNYAVRFTVADGDLYLAHLEDNAVFERYMEIISKIPEIDTEMAREEIRQQLLKEPRDYIESCREVLAERQIPLQVHPVVAMGRHIIQCRRLIDEQSIDLVVMPTKDDEQLAMHGLAYPLAIELRGHPLLLL